MFEYHGHVVKFEWQSKHARRASTRVCGESQRGSACTGGFVCERPYGTACASANAPRPAATTISAHARRRWARRTPLRTMPVLRERRRQVSPEDLRRRRPEGVGCGDARVPAPAGRLVAQVERSPSGQEEAAEHRLERVRPDGGAGPRGDRLCYRVCLLRRDAALLDREGGDVACRED